MRDHVRMNFGALNMTQPLQRPCRALIAAGVLALAACSSGGSVGGGGQSSDPGTVDFPVFYVKRTVPEDQDDLRQMRDAVPDADLFMKATASPSAAEVNITAEITGASIYDVKDVDVSADGKKVVFAMRGPLAQNMDEEDPPTWNIWEYDVVAKTTRRVIPSDTVAEDGNDVSPHYLPDGRIVFSSTRQRQSKAILLDENKPQFEAQNEDRNEPAFVLHVMNADGSGIKQISFNASNDFDPTVLADGRILFSRWDHAPGKNGIHLYTTNPDGTGLELYYGANSHNTGTNDSIVQFTQPHEMQDGRILTLVRDFTDADFGGAPVIIDAKTYVENTQPTLPNAGMQGPAQSFATPNDVRTIPGPSPGGRFNSVFPLGDGTNRILVSWSQCRLLDTTAGAATIVPCTDTRLADPDVEVAPPLYSLWMFDPGQNTLLPVIQPTEGVMITEVAAAQPRPLPAVILDKVIGLDLNGDFVSEGVGVLNIKSVYDFDGGDTATPSIRGQADPAIRTAAQRPARFIRLEKAVSIPDDDVLDLDNAAFGITPYMREILGYAPVEPDGSVRIKVPADVAFQISILDSDGRRVSPIHRNWMQVRPGEEIKCNGCHSPATPTNPRSHGRSNGYAPAYTGALTTGVAFPNTNPTFSPNSGETMAEVRSRLSCASGCTAMNPSVDLVYTDVWTNSAVRAPDPDLLYRYSDLRTTLPTTLACSTAWSSTCRITINYTQHIQPLWALPRVLLAADGVTVLQDNTCVSCHSPLDAMNAVRVPAGQLDLSDGASDEQPLQLRAYRELLFTDSEQEVNMGALQDRLVPGPIDPNTGQPTQVTVGVAPSMGAGNARASTRFFSRFAAGGSHAGYMTLAELRLLSEWLDIGAQYFNNPFDPTAPVN